MIVTPKLSMGPPTGHQHGKRHSPTNSRLPRAWCRLCNPASTPRIGSSPVVSTRAGRHGAIKRLVLLPDEFCASPFGPRGQLLEIMRRLLCCSRNDVSRRGRTSPRLQEVHETWCTYLSTSQKPTPPRCTG